MARTRAKSDPTRMILDSIRYLVQALRASAIAAEQKAGVSGAQLFVLQVLAQEDALSLNEIAARTFTHQSSVSVVVSRLVQRQLVHRSVSREDGRRLELSLTPRGRGLLSRVPPTAQEQILRGLKKLSPADRGRLAASLRTLVSGLDRRSPAPMFFEEASGRSEKKPNRRSQRMENRD